MIFFFSHILFSSISSYATVNLGRLLLELVRIMVHGAIYSKIVTLRKKHNRLFQVGTANSWGTPSPLLFGNGSYRARAVAHRRPFWVLGLSSVCWRCRTRQQGCPARDGALGLGNAAGMCPGHQGQAAAFRAHQGQVNRAEGGGTKRTAAVRL